MRKFVQIFKYLILISSIIFCYDSDLIKVGVSDSTDINKFLLDKLSDDKNPTGYFELVNFNKKSSFLEYRKSYMRSYLDTLIVKSSKPISQSILKNINKSLINIPIGNNFEKESEKLFRRYNFLNKPLEAEYGLVRENIFGGYIFIDPVFENYFSGILGLGNSNEGGINLNGEIDIHVENIFKQAGSYQLYWKKIDSLSQKISLELKEPHLPIFNFGFYWKYQREFFQNLYSLNEHEIRIHYYLPYINNFGIGYKNEMTSPTKYGNSLGYEIDKNKSLTFALENKSLDSRILPRNGYHYELKINKSIDSKTNFIEKELDFEYYFPIFDYYILKLSAKNRYLWSEKPIPKTRYVFFGGSTTLRGFQENQFSTSNYQTISLDFGFDKINQLRSSFFIDHGFTIAQEINYNKTSIGIGIIQTNKESVIKIEYAIPIEQGISNGKVHIKYISRF